MFGAFWAPGWPETDSPRKIITKSGVETRIRALGIRFVTFFRFWKTFGAQPPPDASRDFFWKLPGFARFRWKPREITEDNPGTMPKMMPREPQVASGELGNAQAT